jgi:hypothetical protein
VPSIHRRTFSKVNHCVENLAACAVYELLMGVGRELKMQSPQDPLTGNRVVFLLPIRTKTVLGEYVMVERLDE